jgi:histidine phosphotransferase ChpT
MPQLTDCLRLAELMCMRLCHDFSGLVGTIDAALDLAGEDHGDEELALAGDAARELTARLRCYRAAWGGARNSLSPDELRRLTAGMPNARAVSLETSALPADTRLPPPVATVTLNLLLLAGESLPRGGHMLLAGSQDDLFLRIVGPNAAWPQGFAACIADPQAAILALNDARTIQMPLTALLAHGHGLRLSMLIGPAPVGAPPPVRLEAR